MVHSSLCNLGWKQIFYSPSTLFSQKNQLLIKFHQFYLAYNPLFVVSKSGLGMSYGNLLHLFMFATYYWFHILSMEKTCFSLELPFSEAISLLAINSARAEFFTDLTYLSRCFMKEEFNNYLFNQKHSEKENISIHLPTEGPDKPPLWVLCSQAQVAAWQIFFFFSQNNDVKTSKVQVTSQWNTI